jgi:hypothetical protein
VRDLVAVASEIDAEQNRNRYPGEADIEECGACPDQAPNQGCAAVPDAVGIADGLQGSL